MPQDWYVKDYFYVVQYVLPPGTDTVTVVCYVGFKVEVCCCIIMVSTVTVKQNVIFTTYS